MPENKMLRKVIPDMQLSSNLFTDHGVDSEYMCLEINADDRQFNSLWLGDAICWHISESTLPQVMAFCLTASSHYLNQC